MVTGDAVSTPKASGLERPGANNLARLGRCSEHPGDERLPPSWRDGLAHDLSRHRPRCLGLDACKPAGGLILSGRRLPSRSSSRGFRCGLPVPAGDEAGDVAIASNWIIHGSHENAAMTKNRASMELRFIGTCPDIAVTRRLGPLPNGCMVPGQQIREQVAWPDPDGP